MWAVFKGPIFDVHVCITLGVFEIQWREKFKIRYPYRYTKHHETRDSYAEFYTVFSCETACKSSEKPRQFNDV